MRNLELTSATGAVLTLTATVVDPQSYGDLVELELEQGGGKPPIESAISLSQLEKVMLGIWESTETVNGGAVQQPHGRVPAVVNFKRDGEVLRASFPVYEGSAVAEVPMPQFRGFVTRLREDCDGSPMNWL